jgi:hypothetical protein
MSQRLLVYIVTQPGAGVDKGYSCHPRTLLQGLYIMLQYSASIAHTVRLRVLYYSHSHATGIHDTRKIMHALGGEGSALKCIHYKLKASVTYLN